MKKSLKSMWVLATFALCLFPAFGQSPNSMSYQAVVRNSSDALVTNTQIGMEINIRQGSVSGTVVYTETQTPTTNANGLVSIEIGSGANFTTIDWSAGPYFIETKTDPSGGTNYTITGTSQLLSVPYALHAKTAESVSGGITETDPVFTASVASGITVTDTANWNNKLDSYTETDPMFTVSVASGITAIDTANWNKKLDSYTETDPVFAVSVAKGITAIDTANWNKKLDSYTETDPVFTASVAKGITATDTANWNKKLDSYTETDPVFSVSVARSITATDTANWNKKLDSYTETDPFFTASDAAGIDTTDIANWNQKQDALTAGVGIAISNDTISADLVAGIGISISNDTISMTPGTAVGEMLYWNGTDWVNVPPGSERQFLVILNGVPTWLFVSGITFISLGPDDVFNPITQKVWFNRNLGTSQVATSSTDTASYGDLYQWGRGTDGHEKRNSGTTSSQSSGNSPEHGNFIIGFSDWRASQNNNLWQGISGNNNPCPSGYRLPTEAEWNAERLSWGSNNSAGAFASPLKLPVAGIRYIDGSLYDVGSYGSYWSSTVYGTDARGLYFNSSSASMNYNLRAIGFSVRCIKD